MHQFKAQVSFRPAHSRAAVVVVSQCQPASPPLPLPPRAPPPDPAMAFAARRSLASRLSHHLTRRLHPATAPHLLASHSDDDPSPPPELPPFPHSPSPRHPRAGQALDRHLLPFSLHHLAGPRRRGFSSAAGEVDAAAGVLADAAAAAEAVPAPFPGEVAAAAADSFFPVAALQHVIDYIHTFTGLNW